MNVRATPVQDAAAHISEWVGVHTDVEDQNAAAAALAASESRFQAIFDGLPDPVLLYALGTDGPGPFQMVNKAAVDALRLLGRRAGRDERHGPARARQPLRFRTRSTCFGARARRRSTRSTAPATAARSPSRRRRGSSSYDGQLCVLALARDDSERRAFQRELSRANLGLERTVAERTAALQTFADALRTVQSITARPFPTETRADRGVPARRLRDARHAHRHRLGHAPRPGDGRAPLPHRGHRLARPAHRAGLTIPLREAFCDAVVERGETVVYADAATKPRSPATRPMPRAASAPFSGRPSASTARSSGRSTSSRPSRARPASSRSSATSSRSWPTPSRGGSSPSRAEQQRRHTEDYYRAVVETIEDGIVTLDAECRITMSNPSARLLLGLAPEARHDAEARRQHLDTDSGGALVPAAVGHRARRRDRRPRVAVARHRRGPPAHRARRPPRAARARDRRGRPRQRSRASSTRAGPCGGTASTRPRSTTTATACPRPSCCRSRTSRTSAPTSMPDGPAAPGRPTARRRGGLSPRACRLRGQPSRGRRTRRPAKTLSRSLRRAHRPRPARL